MTDLPLPEDAAPASYPPESASIGAVDPIDEIIETVVLVSDVPEGTVWKRPHPYTLIIELVSSIRDLMFPIVFIFFQSRNNESGSLWVQILPLVAIVAPIGAGIARYYSTRYAITPEAVHHHYGVFRKNKQVLPRRNIQNLSTQAGLIARATGLQELKISDASQGGDISLRLLSEDDAAALMTLLRGDVQARALELSGDGAVSGPGAASGLSGLGEVDGLPAPTFSPAVESDPVYALSIADLLKFRLVASTSSLVAGVVSLGVAVGVPAFFFLSDDDGSGSFSEPLFAIAPVLGAIGIAFGQIFQLGGFRLWSDPDRLRIKTGLLTEVQMSARRDRIQMVQVDRHILAQKIGLEAVRFETADVEGGNRVSHLAPATPKDTWQGFASDALGEVELAESDLQRVSPLTKRRSLVRFAVGGLPVLVSLLVVILLVEIVPLWVLVPWAAALGIYATTAVWYSSRRALRLGWAVGQNQFLFRNGVIGEKLLLVRKEKLQTLRIHQSFFQRRLGLATLSLGTAGLGLLGAVSLPDLELDQAENLLSHLAIASADTPLSRTL